MTDQQRHEDRGPAGTSDTDDTEQEPRSSASPSPTDRTRRHAQARASLPLWQESLLLLAVALVLAIVIKALFMQAFYIPSGSMNDTLVLNDRILVQKVSYWGDGEPQRGDIVVFADPGGWLDAAAGESSNPVAKALELFGLYPTGGHLVKRVIGVGGDRVKCCDKRGRITVNGVPLNEGAYLAPGQQPSMIDFDVKVEEGYLWVQGDNRSNSADSRVHLGDPGGGQVPVDDVVGKVFAVVWPLGHAKLLQRPATFESVD
ncbi:signal peptidase I [Nocardioides iriomotensis]|uniref:Signal peptidase I n=1 Tax=Nocardioides iriomotensis TaxID=715784 RepID=A0A4Q5J1F9_9ACTN|nr:signal peptidase I [Nocardioides iriomotensis]RYU12342.1 signal peptidase I [Nocardioides iriomotensis]